ncbi:hypothetical protein Poli38472_012474 [Pythium oligandrum]|uniref:Uncharacterized protein n=1 Tax=Pythium oligandrum TaxID=41045 RepID=A0A8K1CS73_PYTOL|nr:hypothetical protein Poli38472_012474 [Pythium oligandrum]|eukprot:TMW67358.1 hypothetical protein Poli38472_012474 [Pythium oligandrum]
MDEVDLGLTSVDLIDLHWDDGHTVVHHGEEDQESTRVSESDKPQGLRSSFSRRIVDTAKSSAVLATTAAAKRAQAAMQKMRRSRTSEDHTVDERMELIGQTPLLQPKDELLFIERTQGSSTRVVERGDFIRVQSTSDPTLSWLLRVSTDRDLPHEADMLPLATPFEGPEMLDLLVYFVPEECLPPEMLAENEHDFLFADDDDTSSDEDDEEEPQSGSDNQQEPVRRSSESATSSGHTSVDDDEELDLMLSRFSTGDDVHSSSSTTRGSMAREKAAAFYEKYKTKKSSFRLRTSSTEYKERLEAARVASVQKLQQLRQSEYKEKLAAAGHASKQKLENLAKRERLSAAGQVSKEKLQKMQSWTSSARTSMKDKMMQRVRARSGSKQTAPPADDIEMMLTPATPTSQQQQQQQRSSNFWGYDPSTDDMREEFQLRRELDDC